ncbi:LNS2-domain-containing protein [Trametes punicea]|nr:LNS2-domain-containing protein [Trametes punicea]
MNYLRGAVSAISAPYQYYKDLNPSTLTGAIDVIVVRRPKDIHELPPEAPPRQLTDEETELVCSPFHVRFGKWQVLRPQDKKVDVFVNGQLVPFSMKIGEAGEAFFVFETDEDVPDSLVTSPILEATKPGQTNAQAGETGRFGAGAPSPQPKESQGSSQEPEFLDLNASPESQSRDSESASPTTPKPSETSGSSGHSLLTRTAHIGKAVMGVAHEVEKTEADKLKDKTVMEAIKEAGEGARDFARDKETAALNATGNAAVGITSTEDKGDEILPEEEMEKAHEPDVRYTDSMVFDMEGYHAHAHGREASDATLKSRNPGGSSHSGSSSPDRTPGPSRTPSPTPSIPPPPSSVAFPTFRATSEPPPDHDDYPASTSRLANSATVTRTPSASTAPRPHLPTLPTVPTSDTEEYTWDWGNFPQKTPVRTTFPHALGHGHGHLSGTSVDLTPRKGKGRMLSEEPDRGRVLAAAPADANDNAPYGLGGRLTVDKDDPTRFRVFIEGRTVEFELALIKFTDSKKSAAGPLGGEDEVEDEKRFEESKVDFERFLNDESVVRDANLVLRWAGDKYIRRQDGSPLMEALVTWRESALRDQQSSHLSSRSPSLQPLSEDEAIKSEGDEPASEGRRPKRSITSIGNETAADSAASRAAPTSSSWVRWWSRSRRTETARPDFNHTNSEPPAVAAAKLKVAGSEEVTTPMRRTTTSVSAPPLPSTPESTPSSPGTLTPDSQGTPEPRKRFAKTLRLTSNQLKSLNLKSGANSVTFSLSSTGVAACSARLFVWEWTDLVVVSDIDGTITKSDALGHVFTMIGRDWTHLGVAKLYTDICRNGYKIMYLTSRAIGQADSTREYLKGIKQNEYQLPEGPVIMSPDRLMASLHREVIMRKPEVFKMACLRDIQKLFGGPTHNPFYAGFGNRITDALSYRSVNIPSSRIFTIDSSGEVKMELLELAGYKSSYIHMTDLVDQMFPPINRKWASQYTDFNYWKTPIQDFPLPDLFPPSPALSARSDTSNQSTFARLRNFSLVSSRQPSKQPFTLPPPATEPGQGQAARNAQDTSNENRLRQMTSFERLSSTLASLSLSSSSTVGSPRSSSPTLHDESESEYDEDDGDVEGQKVRRKRRRRRSVTSMPGSLPGSEPGSDDEMVFGHNEDEDHGYEGEGENEEEVPDEALDEALFAAGEMKNVDYI